MTKDKIPPAHGGCGLINRIVPEVERDSFIAKASKYKVYNISNADLSLFNRIADGGLSPLEGPMDQGEFNKVLKDEIIERDGKQYAWTIPIVFPISQNEAKAFEIGEMVVVKNEYGVIIGTLEISDIYPFEKEAYNESVYGTERKDHPGPRIVNEDPRDYLLGGKIWALPALDHPVYGKYMLEPEETRNLFKERGWERILAFQTRNPLHRAHEYALVYGAEQLTRDGFFSGVVLNPLVGATKSDDIPAEVRMRSYESLIKNKLLGYGDKDDQLWKDKGYDLSEQFMLIGLDMKMFYAGPKEAIMHAIYRQNYGFSHIVIGRKHADAPFDDGKAAWGDFDAQEKFSQLNGELITKPLKVGFAAYYEELGRVGLVSEFKDKGYRQISISGKDLRKKLQAGEDIDERIMRKPVSEILIDFYAKEKEKTAAIKSTNITWHETGISKQDRERRNRHKAAVLWFTGLPSSGKSTVAVELQALLFERGYNVYLLDGDNVRHGLNSNLGFSPQDRQENIRRISEVAKLFADAGFLVITSFISPYRNDRQKARGLLKSGDFIEVFVKADLSICEQRDPKGLYKKARSGEIKQFTGVSAPYEEPEKAEIVIDTGSLSKEESAMTILTYLSQEGYIEKEL